ncbi:hypothetical protein AVEN_18887-1 [Araneus ventricosus]|uniref:Pre-C2HC domain-containing protein n=1 Tax=Araneus ventricosus TaxID=182803 RepID=A0A4Y1ZWY3_ARAVE|nr:hypothetical protein AVEN_18887-1 [Araneus ventricosus]
MMAPSDDEETRFCAGDQHMQIDTDDKVVSGHTTPEQYCEVCEERLKVEHELKLLLAKQHGLRSYTRVLTEHRRFDPTNDGEYQDKLQEIEFVEEQMERQRGKLNSLPICNDEDCYGRIARKNDNIRQAKNKDSRDKEFRTPPRRKTSKQPQSNSSPTNMVQTNNSFEVLTSQTDQDNENNQSAPEPEKVPPIMLRFTDNYQDILIEITKACGLTENKLNNGIIKMFPESHKQHQEISNFCSSQGYDFHVIAPANKRPLKVVIKYLPPNHDPEEIKNFLKNELEFPVEKVTQLKKFRTREPLPFFLVELQKTKKATEIYNIKHINYLKVLVEEYKGRDIINQCYKCNWYHHKAGECQSNARCLKCAGPHETNKCSITSTIPNPKCINCGEVGHVASYRGCKMFPKKTTPQQNRTNNFISNRNTFNPETNRIRENFSFARVTNPQQRQEMAPRTQTYPVPSTNVQQINLTDNSLRDMVEGINELKKLLLEFPNLFTTLKSLKDVKDPIAKIQILAHAISNPGTSGSG